MLGTASAAVRIDAGRRPEQATHVAVAEWEGPLGLLLSLIEANRLDVLTVPLGALAEAYLDALATLEGDVIGSISVFVAVASQLILIKSRQMLPRPLATAASGGDLDEGPDPEAALRARLLLYRAYRDAGVALQAVAEARLGIFRREPGVAAAAGLAGARPPDGPAIDVALLPASLSRLVTILPEMAPPPEIVIRTITIGERVRIIREALAGAPAVVLQDLLRGVRDKVVVAITFLAMLELMKRREIVVEQAEPFGPITARRTTADERSRAGVAADVEEAPIDESLESFA
jgi:segregation and condensation protein A